MAFSFLNRATVGRRPRDSSPQARWTAGLRSSDGNAATDHKNLLAPPRHYCHVETGTTQEAVSPRTGPCSIPDRVDRMSDNQVLEELKKHHPSVTPSSFSSKDARSFLTHLLTTKEAPSERFERAMAPSPRVARAQSPRPGRTQSPRKIGSPRAATAGKERPRTMPAEVDTVLRRCKAAGMSTDYFWRQIDRDMTNTVTRGEFEEGLKLVRLYLQRTELDALFRWFDKDGSGSVDYQEFMHAMGNKSVAPLGPRWDSSPMPRYRKEEEAAATLSPRVRAPEPAAHGTRRAGQPVELEMAKTWTDVSDLGATVLEHKLVECRKPENASAHARWTSMLRAEAPRAVSQSEKIGSPQWKPPPTAHRVAAHPDGTLELHSKANQPVAAVQARHVESRIRQPVPKNMGRIKEELSSPRAAVPRVRLAHNSQAEMPEQVSLVLQRMKRHGMADCYLFHRMDIDRNDQVSLNEFKKGLRLLHIRLPPDELDTLFSYFDRDKSGRIDYNELQLALRTTNADGSLYPKPAWNIKSPRYAASGHGEFGQMVHSNNNGPL